MIKRIINLQSVFEFEKGLLRHMITVYYSFLSDLQLLVARYDKDIL